jgi:hypothetical protein
LLATRRVRPGDPTSDANIDGTFSRPFNHFYDPVHNIPLTVLGFVTPGVKAPDWATGAKDSIGNPNVPSVVSQLGTVQQATVTDLLAEYLIVQNTANGPNGFLVYLMLGDDGIWRIDGM